MNTVPSNEEGSRDVGKEAADAQPLTKKRVADGSASLKSSKGSDKSQKKVHATSSVKVEKATTGGRKKRKRSQKNAKS